MPHGEAARRPQHLEIEPSRHQRGVIADAGPGHLAPTRDRVEPESLEHGERRPLRHALGEPLLTAAFALRQLELRHVRELVRHEPKPLAAVLRVRLVVEEELTALADPDGELGELGRPGRRQMRVVDQPILEDLARGIDVHDEAVRHREPQIPGEDCGNAAHGRLVRRERTRLRDRRRARLHRHRQHDAAVAAAAEHNGHERKDSADGGGGGSQKRDQGLGLQSGFLQKRLRAGAVPRRSVQARGHQAERSDAGRGEDVRATDATLMEHSTGKRHSSDGHDDWATSGATRRADSTPDARTLKKISLYRDLAKVGVGALL
jgi:hypothetical protein